MTTARVSEVRASAVSKLDRLATLVRGPLHQAEAVAARALIHDLRDDVAHMSNTLYLAAIQEEEGVGRGS